MRGCKPAQIQSDQDAIADKKPAPGWLSKEAKAEWSRVMPILIERRILTDADLASFENYCVAIGQVRQMEKAIKQSGHVVETARGPRAHPAVKIQADAMNRARLLAAELGLTPVSRSRPSVRDDEEDDDISPLDM
jgi:P27 family predicted phage terminase small subunit